MEEIDRAETLSVKVSNKIKKRIAEGKWRVGDKIPNEQILANEMNVSRTTIREAIKILTSSNILHIERGVGTYVVSVPDITLETFYTFNGDETVLVYDICEYRLYLEPVACMLAAQRAKEEHLRKMNGIIHDMMGISMEMRNRSNQSVLVDKLAMLEIQFHTLIYQMTNNVLFQRIGKIMNSTVYETYMTEYYRSGVISDRLRYAEVHAEIYEAICKHDPERARIASKKHMEITYRELIGSDKDQCHTEAAKDFS